MTNLFYYLIRQIAFKSLDIKQTQPHDLALVAPYNYIVILLTQNTCHTWWLAWLDTFF